MASKVDHQPSLHYNEAYEVTEELPPVCLPVVEESIISGDQVHHENSTRRQSAASINQSTNETKSSEKFGLLDSYSSKMTAANGMLDMALMMAHATQLKQLIQSPGNHTFFVPTVLLLSLSLFLQILLGVFLLVLARIRLLRESSPFTTLQSSMKDLEEGKTCQTVSSYDAERKMANRLNNLFVIGVFILSIDCVFLAAFAPQPMIINTNTTAN